MREAGALHGASALVKTKLRTLLGDDIFADLVQLAFNLPHLHEIDVAALVQAWKDSGHKLPFNKNDADSIVLTRLYERKSHDRGFYLKKEHDFKPTDKSYLDAVRPPKSPRSSPRPSRTPSPRAADAAPAPA